jgi:hypothetical protein
MSVGTRKIGKGRSKSRSKSKKQTRRVIGGKYKHVTELNQALKRALFYTHPAIYNSKHPKKANTYTYSEAYGYILKNLEFLKNLDIIDYELLKLTGKPTRFTKEEIELRDKIRSGREWIKFKNEFNTGSSYINDKNAYYWPKKYEYIKEQIKRYNAELLDKYPPKYINKLDRIPVKMLTREELTNIKKDLPDLDAQAEAYSEIYAEKERKWQLKDKPEHDQLKQEIEEWRQLVARRKELQQYLDEAEWRRTQELCEHEHDTYVRRYKLWDEVDKWKRTILPSYHKHPINLQWKKEIEELAEFQKKDIYELHVDEWRGIKRRHDMQRRLERQIKNRIKQNGLTPEQGEELWRPIDEQFLHERERMKQDHERSREEQELRLQEQREDIESLNPAENPEDGKSKGIWKRLNMLMRRQKGLTQQKRPIDDNLRQKIAKLNVMKMIEDKKYLNMLEPIEVRANQGNAITYEPIVFNKPVLVVDKQKMYELRKKRMDSGEKNIEDYFVYQDPLSIKSVHNNPRNPYLQNNIQTVEWMKAIPPKNRNNGANKTRKNNNKLNIGELNIQFNERKEN